MHRRISAAAAMLLGVVWLGVLAPARGWADSLLLKDGRLITGQVRHTDSGYVIRTRSGEQTISENDVEHWTHSESAEPADLPPAATATPATAHPPAVATPATPAGPPSGAKTSQQKTVAVLVERGNDALGDGDYKAARDSYTDALVLDPKNAAAAQGAGYAYLRLNNYFKARDELEVAYAALQPPPRSLACNMALALAKTHNPMRAAKVLKEYMAAHPTPLDEPALNALAAALFQADEQTRRNSFFATVAQFYDDYNKKLEATRPGEKRWGTRWLPAAEAEKKLKTYFDKRSKIEELSRQMANDQAAYANASANAEAATSYARSHPAASGKIVQFQSQMQAANNEFQKASAEYVKAQEGFEFPPIDESLAVVIPESATATLASATPAPATAAPPGTTPDKPAPAVDLTAHLPPPVAAPADPSPARLFGPDTSAAPVARGGVIAAAPAEPAAPKRKLHIQTNAVAFAVAPDLVITAAEAVAGASSITLQIPESDVMTAEVVAKDASTGLALLRVPGKRLAFLPLADSFAGGAVTCISFPDVNLFDPAAAAISGTAAPGAGGKWVASLSRSPRLGGGPLLVNGKVVGIQLASRDSDPRGIPVATLDEIKKLLSGNLPTVPAPAGFDPKTITMQLTAVREKG